MHSLGGPEEGAPKPAECSGPGPGLAVRGTNTWALERVAGLLGKGDRKKEKLGHGGLAGMTDGTIDRDQGVDSEGSPGHSGASRPNCLFQTEPCRERKHTLYALAEEIM